MPRPTHPYVRMWEGWLYLATVLDVFSRRVIGWALADHLRASLVCAALRMAVATRGGYVAGVIFHSDRGCTRRPSSATSPTRTGCSSRWAGGVLGQRAGRVVFRDVQARADRAGDLADTRSGTDGDRAVARSDLQPAASALAHRHAEPRRLRGAVLGSPRSGSTRVSTRPRQDQWLAVMREAAVPRRYRLRVRRSGCWCSSMRHRAGCNRRVALRMHDEDNSALGTPRQRRALFHGAAGADAGREARGPPDRLRSWWEGEQEPAQGQRTQVPS